MKIKVKKLVPEAKLPTYASAFSAGADLYAAEGESVLVPAGKTVLVHTGIAMEIPEGYGGFLYARSGLATKKDIDSDYRGEIMVALHNHGTEDRTVEAGERIAQLVIAPFLKGEFVESEGLADTLRGDGGFGSTGTK